MKKKKTKILIIIIVLIAIAVLTFVGMWKSFNHKMEEATAYPANTVINGIDVSDMDKNKARKKVIREWNRQSVAIKDGEDILGTVTLDGTKYKVKAAFKDAVSHAGFFQYMSHIFGRPFEITVPMTVRKTSSALKDELDAFCDKQDIGCTQTSDAYVDINEEGFALVDEVYGTNVDRDKLADAVEAAIEDGTLSVSYNREDYYDLPEVTAESEEIVKKMEFCEKYLSAKITYTFGKKKITITPVELDRMLDADENGELKINKDEVHNFVYNLGYNTNTYAGTRIFKSTRQGKIQVSGGAYGYVISQEKEEKQLIKDLKAGKDVEREPVYYYTGKSRNGNDDIPDTYLEVDLSAQHLWYYKNGKVILQSDFVSGCTKNNTGTITGVYSIAYKERDAKLKGQNIDGSDYESEVKYWMPFCNGYGLHDADWRNKFGGTIYKANGSHGCINLPPAFAGKLFEAISAGDVIVIFY